MFKAWLLKKLAVPLQYGPTGFAKQLFLSVAMSIPLTRHTWKPWLFYRYEKFYKHMEKVLA